MRALGCSIGIESLLTTKTQGHGREVWCGTGGGGASAVSAWCGAVPEGAERVSAVSAWCGAVPEGAERVR